MNEPLTREILEQLRRPFPAATISFKCQTKPGENGYSLVVAYIDARDVMERLDEVVGPDWSDRYEKAGTARGLVCYLTVCGVTRADVGDDDNENEPAKSAYSDAFKRAAVKFGVGRFLYDLPKMWGKARAAGKSFVLEDGESDRLRRQVDEILSGKKAASSSSGSNGRGRSSGAQNKVHETSELRRRHSELWSQCMKAGLLEDEQAVQAWSAASDSSESDVARKVAAMEAALQAAGVTA